MEEFLKQHDAFQEDRVCFYEGDFGSTLAYPLIVAPDRKAAIVHIDCDLYESAIVALRFIEPRLVPGAVILFDDWNCYGASPLHGERLAVSEVFGKESMFTLEFYSFYGWHGAAFIVTRTL